MNQVIEELNRTKENYILKIMNLEEEMKDLTGVCLKLQGDHQDAMQVIITEKEEMSHKLSVIIIYLRWSISDVGKLLRGKYDK